MRPVDGLSAVRTVRDAFVAADNANDSAAMVALLTDDVVILHPRCGIIAGRDDAAAFIARVLAEVGAEYDKRARYSTMEVKVADDFAYERGKFAQELVPRAGGAAEYDSGEYLWVYAKGNDGVWRIARIAGAFDMAQEEEPC